MAGPDWSRPWDTGVVRPFGYRHDEPIVRRIGDRDLFLGNRHAADPARCDRSFDDVVSLTRDPRPATTHHRPLVDGPGTDWRAFEAAADTACGVVGDGTTLIHCSQGISRSATLCAVAVAVGDDRPLREGLDAVQRARPPALPHPALFEQAVVYVTARS